MNIRQYLSRPMKKTQFKLIRSLQRLSRAVKTMKRIGRIWNKCYRSSNPISLSCRFNNNLGLPIKCRTLTHISSRLKWQTQSSKAGCIAFQRGKCNTCRTHRRRTLCTNRRPSSQLVVARLVCWSRKCCVASKRRSLRWWPSITLVTFKTPWSAKLRQRYLWSRSTVSRGRSPAQCLALSPTLSLVHVGRLKQSIRRVSIQPSCLGTKTTLRSSTLILGRNPILSISTCDRKHSHRSS